MILKDKQKKQISLSDVSCTNWSVFSWKSNAEMVPNDLTKTKQRKQIDFSFLTLFHWKMNTFDAFLRKEKRQEGWNESHSSVLLLKNHNLTRCIC